MKGVRRPPGKIRVVDTDDGFTVTLDGRVAVTPAGAVLAVPTRSLARALADEWAGRQEEAGPMTRLANAAIDHVGPEREAVIDHVLGYAVTDLVCYRAESPDDLVERQHGTWQPLLDWLADAHQARLKVTHGVIPVAQPPASLGALRRTVEGLDDADLAVLAAATGASGSLIIALALVAGRIDAEGAWRASQLDETFQRERWGEDSEDADRRRRLRAEMNAAGRFRALRRDPG